MTEIMLVNTLILFWILSTLTDYKSLSWKYQILQFALIIHFSENYMVKGKKEEKFTIA